MATKPRGNALPVLPLRNLVLFPGSVLTAEVGRSSSMKLIEEVLTQSPSRLLTVTQRSPETEDPTPADLHTMAVEAEVLKVVRLSSTRLSVVLRGLERRRTTQFAQNDPFLLAESDRVTELHATGSKADALAIAVRDAQKRLHEAGNSGVSDEQVRLAEATQEPARLADLCASPLDLTVPEKIVLVEELDVEKRLQTVLSALQHRLEVLEVKAKIDTQVRDELSKQQREVVLRQRMKAIQEELGEGEESSELDELEERLRGAGLPEEAEKAARRQLSRLRNMPPQAGEYTVARTYLEWILDLPWAKRTEDRLDIAEARKILEADHYGLEKVKKRILEYLGVRKLAKSKKGPILCLSGPPGVGKTSLGRSIARSLGREFVRMSLGGVRDEAEIRGHRRTYIGALPGRMIQSMKKAGVKNPVVMLDEIDKLSADFRGDPSSALLEVLDPEQNHNFSDHYLEVAFDLSETIFIATANDLGTVPGPLRDRMEIIEIPSYTREEKIAIATSHLVPKQLKEHGLPEQAVTFGKETLAAIVEQYTREAGVRNLEREIASVIRGLAVKVASGELLPPEVKADELAEYLGPPKSYPEIAERIDEPGVATGLAWTPVGGEILFIEVSQMTGKGNLVLTGQLGAVMKESAQAALSYIRSHTGELGVPIDFLQNVDLHLHVPQGATPKDGPSAGNAIISAMVSLLTGRKVRSDVAMTGEITLRGAVLPVGGIKEKVLAAHRAGVKRVVLPERNRKDAVDIPQSVRDELEIIFVSRIEETLRATLEPQAVPTFVGPGPTGAATQNVSA
jgi:ATP-dependent Lon protease